MKRIIAFATLFLLLGCAAAVAADNASAGKMPKYLWVQIEQYQAGKQTPYMKLTQAFKEAMADSEVTWLAAMPVAGTGNEAVYVMFPENFASIEKIMAAFMKAGGDMEQKNAALMADGMAAVDHSRSFLAEFQPDLSTLPDKFNPAEATRWKITTYQLRPGYRPEFTELLKEMAAIRGKNGGNPPTLVYWITAGVPMPAYVVVTPLKSLQELDEPPSPASQEMMMPVFRQHMYSIAKSTLAGVSSGIYAIDPKLSLPPKSYVAANPTFWTVKEPTAAAASKGKKASKGARESTR